MFDSAGLVAFVDRNHSPSPLIPIVLGVVKMCSRVASKITRRVRKKGLLSYLGSWMLCPGLNVAP